MHDILFIFSTNESLLPLGPKQYPNLVLCQWSSIQLAQGQRFVGLFNPMVLHNIWKLFSTVVIKVFYLDTYFRLPNSCSSSHSTLSGINNIQSRSRFKVTNNHWAMEGNQTSGIIKNKTKHGIAS